jgi:hypothetical protein
VTPLIPPKPRHPPRRREPSHDASLAPSNRPAETATGAAGSIAVALATLLGVTDDAKLKALTVLVAWLPYIVTWLVSLRRRS